VDKITDPVVKSFWVDEFTKWNDRILQEVISPIQNKVGQFLSSSLIRNIVGQTKSSFDIREIMDNKKILILNLSKGRIGEDNSALIGAMMITKIQLAAMARVDMPEVERKDFYLYVDEFQNFATESFANILSEARKYRLNLILTNQYITQIDEKVRDAIFGNAGTLISFRVGAFDAEFLEKEYEPIFTMNDLVNLPKYNIYLKLMIDGIAGDAFSAKTLPPIELKETLANEEKVINVSRERYASSRAEVEEKINRWSGMVIPEAGDRQSAPKENLKIIKKAGQVFDNSAKPAVQSAEQKINDQPSDKAPSQLYPAVCATCGIDIQVPFAPDGQRPTFCKDCLKDYQRVMARSRQKSADGEQKIERKVYKESKRDEDPQEMEKKFERKAFVSQESPLTLSQMQHVAPKKFKQTRPKAQVNLDEVRKLIKENRDN
jgi:CxxC-x17-CxxC domain-containing protein